MLMRARVLDVPPAKDTNEAIQREMIIDDVLRLAIKYRAFVFNADHSKLENAERQMLHRHKAWVQKNLVITLRDLVEGHVYQAAALAADADGVLPASGKMGTVASWEQIETFMRNKDQPRKPLNADGSLPKRGRSQQSFEYAANAAIIPKNEDEVIRRVLGFAQKNGNTFPSKHMLNPMSVKERKFWNEQEDWLLKYRNVTLTGLIQGWTCKMAEQYRANHAGAQPGEHSGMIAGFEPHTWGMLMQCYLNDSRKKPFDWVISNDTKGRKIASPTSTDVMDMAPK